MHGHMNVKHFMYFIIILLSFDIVYRQMYRPCTRNF
jgi:hypothetical protein